MMVPLGFGAWSCGSESKSRSPVSISSGFKPHTTFRSCPFSGHDRNRRFHLPPVCRSDRPLRPFLRTLPRFRRSFRFVHKITSFRSMHRELIYSVQLLFHISWGNTRFPKHYACNLSLLSHVQFGLDAGATSDGSRAKLGMCIFDFLKRKENNTFVREVLPTGQVFYTYDNGTVTYIYEFTELQGDTQPGIANQFRGFLFWHLSL